ncbi:hypothetical protein FUSNEC_GEN_294_05955 [Fusobacterium necrophorum subsp. funduliforme]|uniref:hypothetical protein n=1 Tax=Fusobacterium necrophorum TaxID=859 RepID=UPI00370DE71D
MKIIELYTVTFLDWKGIILTDSKPSVEATEENIEKLRVFIENGILRMYDPETDPEPPYENPFEPYMQPVANPFTSGEYDLSNHQEMSIRVEEEEEEKKDEEENKETENLDEEANDIPEEAEGITEDFSKWKKKQLEEKLTQLGVEIPSNARKEQLIELIEKTLKEEKEEL